MVTLYVTCYNQAAYVEETLDNVLKQTFTDTELIILDDHSVDGSQDIIRKWIDKNQVNATFIAHSQNQGLCRSLNEIIEISSGKYIAGIAGDDFWIPQKTEIQVDLLEKHPLASMTFGNASMIDETGNDINGFVIQKYANDSTCHDIGASLTPNTETWKHHKEVKLNVHLLYHNFIPALATMCRRDAIRKVGLYDTTLILEDWDMWVRLAQTSSFIYCDAILGQYRVHSKSTSNSRLSEMEESAARIRWKCASRNWLQGTELQNTTATILHNYAYEQFRKNGPFAKEASTVLFRKFPSLKNLILLLALRLSISHHLLCRIKTLLKSRPLPPNSA